MILLPPMSTARTCEGVAGGVGGVAEVAAEGVAVWEAGEEGEVMVKGGVGKVAGASGKNATY